MAKLRGPLVAAWRDTPAGLLVAIASFFQLHPRLRLDPLRRVRRHHQQAAPLHAHAGPADPLSPAARAVAAEAEGRCPHTVAPLSHEGVLGLGRGSATSSANAPPPAPLQSRIDLHAS